MRATMGFINVSELTTAEPTEPITVATSTVLWAMELDPLPPEVADSNPEQ